MTRLSAADPSAVIPDDTTVTDPAAALAGAVATAVKDAKATLPGPGVAKADTYVTFPICKVDKTEDGHLLVWGRATDDSLDSDLQIIDHKFASERLPVWFATGANIRVQHSPLLYPAGVGVKLDSRDDGQWLTAKVVEPTAKTLVLEKVLTCFSVGIARPRIITDRVAKGGRIVDGEFVEVSLVDRGSNYNSKFTICKAATDGTAEPVMELEAPPRSSRRRKPTPPWATTRTAARTATRIRRSGTRATTTPTSMTMGTPTTPTTTTATPRPPKPT